MKRAGEWEGAKGKYELSAIDHSITLVACTRPLQYLMPVCHNPAFRNSGAAMDIVKLGKKGQLSLPAAVLRKIGLQGAATMLVEATDDGAVILRPAGVYPIEVYTEARIAEFDRANQRAEVEEVRVRKALKRRKR
ncbi:MAG: AbrB/MazE/SpoVT family DNA-binding domain-containing protein [Burkholderiales bacterium]